ncbi:MAG TPA: hypothetical protein VF131_18605 [Blastocatellia bacterium]|nr:hypothetical protein [Blastocatellia bacterium]
MRKPSSVLRLTLDRRQCALIFCVGIILLLSTIAEAQSGRRPPKRSESEGVQRSTEPDPPVKPSETKQPEKEKTQVLIVESPSYYGSSYYSDYVAEGCTARLRQAANLTVNKSEREMNRKEASDAAMSPPGRYVILLELTSERMGYDRRRDNESYPENVVVQYTVFSPGTGKVKTSGRVYARRAATVGGVGIPLPVPGNGPAAAEQVLKQSGREVADRVIDSLGPVPSPKN